jgi:outer membrane lipoprotein SlyB
MKTFQTLRTAAMVAVAALGVSACAPQTNSAVYGSSQAMQASHVQYGTIVDVRYVEMRHMEQGDRAVGVVAGTLLGGAAGSQFGKGDGKTAMTAIGAVAGAALGDNLAQRANRHQATEWFVRLDGGRTVAIVQNDPSLHVGAHVKVIDDGRSTRIVR